MTWKMVMELNDFSEKFYKPIRLPLDEIITPERAADLMEKAADLIETVGHAKGVSRSYGDKPDGTPGIIGYCLSGALSQVVMTDRAFVGRFDTDYRPAYALNLIAEKVGYNPIFWNDEAQRTPGEVIDMLKHTAKELRNVA